MTEFDRLPAVPVRAVPFLKSVLRGAKAEWPALDKETEQQFINAVQAHGIAPLLHDLGEQTGGFDSWPRDLWNELSATRSAQAALELVRRRDLMEVLAALQAGGVKALIFKGAALAYTHFESPELRPRSDTDLFIDRRDLDRVSACFEELGYVSTFRAGRELIFAQASFTRRDRGLLHSYDCHWRLTNRQIVRDTLQYAECVRDAVPIPALGAAAFGLSAAHALIAACVHRVVHHGGSNRLIWLADIHRLACRMRPAELDSFWHLARARKIARIAAESFRATEQWFGAMPSPPPVDSLLEPSSVLLRERLTRLQLLWFDLQSLPRWGERFALALQVISPAPAEAPYVYVRRVVRGFRGWIRKPQPPS